MNETWWRGDTLQTREPMDYNAWLGLRIKEILEERSIKVRTLAKEVNMGRMTLQRILEGRYATPEELEKIAKGLGISVDRLKRKDTANLQTELSMLLSSGQNLWRALQIAKELVSVAIGSSERMDAFTELGRALHGLGDLDGAHEAFEMAFHLVQKGSDSFRFWRSCNNMLNSYLEKKEFHFLTRLLDEIEPMFQQEPMQLGRLKHFRGMCAHARGEMREARGYYLESFECYKGSGPNRLIGRIQIDLAEMELAEGRYEAARDYLLAALPYVQEDVPMIRTIIHKELAKCYLCLGETEQALQLVSSELRHLRRYELEQPDGYSKSLLELLFLWAQIKHDVRPIQNLLGRNAICEECRGDALDFLIEFYLRQGNAKSAYTYFRLLQDSLSGEQPVRVKKNKWILKSV